MQLIFSKKDMDSAYGKVINPILPDGIMLSLPISRLDKKYYYANAIYYPLGKSLKEIIEDLTGPKSKFNLEEYGHCHHASIFIISTMKTQSIDIPN